eukprot:scaffold5093_cov109-Isochrysis_galbana.AAC.2
MGPLAGGAGAPPGSRSKTGPLYCSSSSRNKKKLGSACATAIAREPISMGGSASRHQQRVLLLGIDGAGKSSIVARLNGDEVRTVMPTRGCAVHVLSVAGLEVELLDVGGRREMRRYWPAYAGKLRPGTVSHWTGGGLGRVGTAQSVASRSAILFVIDGADRRRLIEAAKELHTVLDTPELLGVPLLVASNKQDRAGALSAADIVAALHLSSVRDRPWRCVGTSALRGDGLLEAFEWLAKESQSGGGGSAPRSAAKGGLLSALDTRQKGGSGGGRGGGGSRGRGSRRPARSGNDDAEAGSDRNSADEDEIPAEDRASARSARRSGRRAASHTEPEIDDPARRSTQHSAETDPAYAEERPRRRRSAATAAGGNPTADPSAQLVSDASAAGAKEEEALLPGEVVSVASERRRRRRSATAGESAADD